MKKYENDKYLIVDTENSNRLNPIYVFFKETGFCNMLSKRDLEDNLYYPDCSAWEYQTAKLYFDNKKPVSERNG